MKLNKLFLLVAAVALAAVALAFAPTVLIPIAASAVIVVFAATSPRAFRNARLVTAININEGTHCGSITKKVDAALASRFLLVKFGSDVDHVAVNGAADMPLGIASDEAAAAEDLIAVQFLGASESTRKCVASEAIALTDELWTAANGKVQNVTATAGTYYRVGRPLQVAAADGDVIEFEPCFPVKIVVT